MPNKSSHAGHIPERTCVICRKKKKQESLDRFVLLSDRYVIDIKRKLPGRGYYCCQKQECIEKLSRWTSKRVKKQGKKV